MSAPLAQRLEQRFMRYSKITTQSNAANRGKVLPSSPGQQVLAELLAGELKAMGLDNIQCDQFATVTAVKAGNTKGCPTIGFICHLDTYDTGLSPDVHAHKVHYTGGDICLNKEKDIWMRTAEHPELAQYVNQDIIVSDGTSVLGADDKAAITSVMEMIADLDSSKEKHGDIVICFVPDEEIGLEGAKHLDVRNRFHVDFAYTLDCCELGEVVWECFNGGSATVTFTGVTAHPMSAKGVMVNPLMMAVDYMSLFPREETPEHTEMREGYWWFSGIKANASVATLDINIREHDKAKYEQRKLKVLEAVDMIRERYPTAKVDVEMEDVYANIANCLKEDRTAIDLLLEALAAAQVKPKIIPMRGGTDGAALSEKGLLTPNFFTGAHNFHSRDEFLPVPSFCKAYEVCRHIVLLGAQKKKPVSSSL